MRFWLCCLLCVGAFANEIADQYFENLEHLDIEHAPQIIYVSGVPGMGRTTLTKRLAKDLKGIYISSDALRKLSKQKDVSELVRMVGQRVIKESQNHRFILDGGMTSLTKLSKMKKPKETLAIRLEVPREQVEKRIPRSKPNPKDYLKFLDHWYKIYDGISGYDFDFVFDNSDGEFEASYKKLCAKLFEDDLQD